MKNTDSWVSAKWEWANDRVIYLEEIIEIITYSNPNFSLCMLSEKIIKLPRFSWSLTSVGPSGPQECLCDPFPFHCTSDCVYHFQQMATQILTEKAKLIREHPPYPPPKYKHTHTLCSPSSPPPTMEDVSVIPTPCFSGCIDWVFLSLSWICYLKSDCWLRKSKVMWKLHDYLVIKIKWKLPLLIFLRKYNWVWL